MTVKTNSIKINTSKNFEIIDITSKINDLIEIQDGIISIFSKHSTSAIVVNENESGLLDDLEFTLSNLIEDKYSYSHDRIDNNAKSHLKAFLLLMGYISRLNEGFLEYFLQLKVPVWDFV